MGGDRANQGYLRFFRGEWRFLSFGIVMAFLSGFGQSFFLSVFTGTWESELGLSHRDYGLCYAIATGSAALVVASVGRYIDQLDLRLWTALVLVGLAAACGFAPIVSSAALLVVALFALRLTGQGLATHTAFTSMGRYFEQRRGKAMSLAGLGFATGFALFPRLGVAALTRFTWRELFGLCAAFVVVVALPAVLWLLRGQAARHARYLARQWQKQDDDDNGVGEPTPRQWTRREAAGDLRFWVIQPLTLASPFLMTGLIVFYAQIAEEKGWAESLLPESMLAVGVTQYATSLLLGRLVDRVGSLRLLVFTQLPMALGLAVLALFDAPIVAPVYLGLVGITMGSMSPVIGSIYPELYGVVHLGAIRSLTSSLMVVSTALAPFVMGLLVDAGFQMADIAWMGVAHVVLATLAVAWVFRRRIAA